MSEISTEVMAAEAHPNRLPAWATPFALAIRALDAMGLLEQAPEHIRFSRQGGFHPFDVALFLLCHFLTHAGGSPRSGQRSFSGLCRGWASQLAALAGRERWATQATVSRCLAGAGRCDLVGLARWLLGEGSALGPVLRHPASQYRDACGHPHVVLDYDPTVIALRKRGLPMGPDLPVPIARATAVAAPGYSGRKRGEVQIAAHVLSHAGTGTWSHIEFEAGNPHPADVADRVALSALEVARLAQLPPDRTVIRVDGGGDVTAAYRALRKRGLIPLVRMARYTLLQSDYAAALFRQGPWLPVRDSGSGPRREALDLGDYTLDSVADEQEGAHTPMRTRVVVSRYAAEAKHGAGYMMDGYHYEMFGTALSYEGWPAGEVVKCYFERAAIENRFAQLDAETDVLRVYCNKLPGQNFATLMGLWAFNLKVALGAKSLKTLGEVPEQLPRSDEPGPVAVPAPSVEQPAVASVSQPRAEQPAPADRHGQEQPEQTIAQAIAQLPWLRIARKHPGWKWNGARLLCPAGHPAAFGGVIVQGRGKYARFVVPSTCCFACPQRSACTKSLNPGYTRQIHIPGADALPPGTRLGKHKLQSQWNTTVTAQRLLPPPLTVQGRLQPQVPLLLPATLRQQWTALAAACRVEVLAPPSPRPPPRNPHVAQSQAERQHRRQTWAQRLTRNARTAPTQVQVQAQPSVIEAVQRRVLLPDEIRSVV